MSGLWLLFLDELKHLMRVRFLVIIWASMLLLVPSMAFLYVGLENAIPFSFIITQLGMMSALATGAVITSTLINDINNKTLVPFLVRPISSYSILLSRLTAIVVSVFSVVLVSILITKIVFNLFSVELILDKPILFLLMASFVQTIITASLGILLGTLASSPATGMGAFIIFGIQSQVIVVLVMEKLPEWFGGKVHAPVILVHIALFIMFITLIWMSKILKNKIL